MGPVDSSEGRRLISLLNQCPSLEESFLDMMETNPFADLHATTPLFCYSFIPGQVGDEYDDPTLS
jgi:hypothetical protein